MKCIQILNIYDTFSVQAEMLLIERKSIIIKSCYNIVINLSISNINKVLGNAGLSLDVWFQQGVWLREAKRASGRLVQFNWQENFVSLTRFRLTNICVQKLCWTGSERKERETKIIRKYVPREKCTVSYAQVRWVRRQIWIKNPTEAELCEGARAINVALHTHTHKHIYTLSQSFKRRQSNLRKLC